MTVYEDAVIKVTEQFFIKAADADTTFKQMLPKIRDATIFMIIVAPDESTKALSTMLYVRSIYLELSLYET